MGCKLLTQEFSPAPSATMNYRADGTIVLLSNLEGCSYRMYVCIPVYGIATDRARPLGQASVFFFPFP
jgi:hypothetical protein